MLAIVVDRTDDHLVDVRRRLGKQARLRLFLAVCARFGQRPRALARALVHFLVLRSGVPVGQVEGEDRTLAHRALDVDLAAEEPRDLARDGEAETGAAVLAAGGAVGLLEGFEDDLLLVAGDADPAVDHLEGDHVPRPGQVFALQLAAVGLHAHHQPDGALLGELEGIGEKVLEDLLEPLRIGADVAGRALRHLDLEAKILLLRHRPEVPVEEVLEIGQGDVARLDLHLAGFHLGEVEDLVDQAEQISTRRVDRLGILGLLVGEVPVLVVGQQLGEDEQRVERRAQLVAHVGEELALVLGDELQLLRLLLQRGARHLHLAVLDLDVLVLLLQLLGLLLQLDGLLLQRGIGALELLLLDGQLLRLALQLLGQALRLLQELLGTHVGADHVQHDADRLGQLVEEDLMNGAERIERRQFDDGLHLALEQYRQHDDVERRRLAQARADLDVVRGHPGEQDGLLLQRALPDQTLARTEAIGDALALLVRVGGDQLEDRSFAFLVHHEERAVVRGNQRSELAHDQPRHRVQVLLALHHRAELGQVRLEPVLLLVLLRGLTQVDDHLVDVVLELRDLAFRLDGDGAGQVALGHRRGDLADGADLGGQRGGQLVDVVGQLPPGAGGVGHLGLAAQLALDAHLARHAGDLIGECAQRVRHVVDGLGQRGHLALGVDEELLAEIAVGDGRHHAGDAAHLGGQVARHEVHVVGEVLPHAGDAGHVGLSAQLALGAHLAGHAGHFRGEGVQLIDHHVDGVLQLEDLALHVDGDLLGQVAVRHRRRDQGDVAHLAGQVVGHEVHVVGQVLPHAADSADVGLPAQASLGAHLAGDAGHLGGEAAQLVHHGVDGVLERQDLAPSLDGDLL